MANLTMTRKLENYVRRYRRRAGLSQDEMAFLLGCQSGTKVSHYERFARQPSLANAFGYEAVFGAPMRDLFAGVYEQSLNIVQKRAGALAKILESQEFSRGNSRKLEFLNAITSSSQSQVSSDS